MEKITLIDIGADGSIKSELKSFEDVFCDNAYNSARIAVYAVDALLNLFKKCAGQNVILYRERVSEFFKTPIESLTEEKINELVDYCRQSEEIKSLVQTYYNSK
mgnify:CR=1 FL=1